MYNLCGIYETVKVVLHTSAEKELCEFDAKVRDKFVALFDSIEKGKVIPRKKYRAMAGAKGLFEFRVSNVRCAYRGLCWKFNVELLVVVFFRKQTQRTPPKMVKLAKHRLRTYLSRS